jgi:hypothetical protein
MDSDDTLYKNHLLVANEFILNKKSPEVFHLRYDLKDQDLKKYGEGPMYKTRNIKIFSAYYIVKNLVSLIK